MHAREAHRLRGEKRIQEKWHETWYDGYMKVKGHLALPDKRILLEEWLEHKRQYDKETEETERQRKHRVAEFREEVKTKDEEIVLLV